MSDSPSPEQRDTLVNGRLYGAKEICRAIGISHRQLDYWVLIGVVVPRLEQHGTKRFRRFSERDVLTLQRIKKLIDEGVVVSRAAERVHQSMAMEHGVNPGSTAESGRTILHDSDDTTQPHEAAGEPEHAN